MWRSSSKVQKKFVDETIKKSWKKEMLQPVIARHDSSLVTLSSSDAVTVDGTYGNGKFTCQLRNANRGGTHAIKVVPNLVMVPNLFHNMTNEIDEQNTFQGAVGGVGYQWRLPLGHYTQSQLVNEFNNQTALQPVLGRAIKLSVSNLGFMQFYTTSGGSYLVQMSHTMGTMLGFTVATSQVAILPSGVDYGVRVTVPSGSTVTANAIPSMGTTPLVYVVARQVALNRMVASDSKEYNVIATVSLHDVPYGSYGVFRGKDLFIEEVEFRNPRALDQIDVELLDYKYQPLVVDKRYPVILQLKVFHTDTIK